MLPEVENVHSNLLVLERFYKYKIRKIKKEKMPIRIIIQEPSLPSRVVKVSAEEMMAIMRRNSVKQFIPSVLHNNAAGEPVLSHLMWLTYCLDILFNYLFLHSFLSFPSHLSYHHTSWICLKKSKYDRNFYLNIWKLVTGGPYVGNRKGEPQCLKLERES